MEIRVAASNARGNHNEGMKDLVDHRSNEYFDGGLYGALFGLTAEKPQ